MRPAAVGPFSRTQRSNGALLTSRSGRSAYNISAESVDPSPACQVRPGTASKARKKRPMPAWTSGATTRATSRPTFVGA